MEFALPDRQGDGLRVLGASPTRVREHQSLFWGALNPGSRMFFLTLLLQDEDVALPFGSFMEAMPHWAFIIIHSILVLVGFWLARKTKLNGFLLFVLAELSYVTYHAGLTHFLFAHIIAEVCDALALVTIALGLSRRVAPLVPGALQHR